MFQILCSFILIGFIQIFPLDQLHQKHPWPQEIPSVKPDPESMFSNALYVGRVLAPKSDVQLIVELGSWLGASTRFLLDCVPNATVIAVDHWQGSMEHQETPYWAQKLPTLYETFLVNCWHYKNRLIPIKATTLNGLEEIYNVGLKPDVFYVDASHEYRAVKADLEKIYQLFPDAFIMGDDWSWISVRNAVNDFAAENNFVVQNEDNFWMLLRKKSFPNKNLKHIAQKKIANYLR